MSHSLAERFCKYADFNMQFILWVIFGASITLGRFALWITLDDLTPSWMQIFFWNQKLKISLQEKMKLLPLLLSVSYVHSKESTIECADCYFSYVEVNGYVTPMKGDQNCMTNPKIMPTKQFSSEGSKLVTNVFENKIWFLFYGTNVTKGFATEIMKKSGKFVISRSHQNY